MTQTQRDHDEHVQRGDIQYAERHCPERVVEALDHWINARVAKGEPDKLRARCPEREVQIARAQRIADQRAATGEAVEARRRAENEERERRRQTVTGKPLSEAERAILRHLLTHATDEGDDGYIGFHEWTVASFAEDLDLLYVTAAHAIRRLEDRGFVIWGWKMPNEPNRVLSIPGDAVPAVRAALAEPEGEETQ